MKPKVLITDRICHEALAYLEEYCECVLWEGEGKIPKEELMKLAAQAQGIINDMIRIDREVIESAPQLKAVCNLSVGYNNLDLEAMRERGILGTNTPGVLNDSVADLIVALMLAAARRIPELDRYVKRGSWQLKDYKSTFGVDVHHSTVGIIGMGRIGETVAKRLRFGFDATVLYHNRNPRPDVEKQLGVQWRSQNELLSESDFVVLMTPLNAETRHLIRKEQLSMMKSSAILINASRGATVDEQALIHALESGTIRAAGLDVFELEPVAPDNELLSMDNVVTLPHLGTATQKTTDAMAMLAAQNMVEALYHNTAPNVVPELRR